MQISGLYLLRISFRSGLTSFRMLESVLSGTSCARKLSFSAPCAKDSPTSIFVSSQKMSSFSCSFASYTHLSAFLVASAASMISNPEGEL